MANSKTYTITVKQAYLQQLLDELKAWDENRYAVQENVITTKEPNVVDVATETFMDSMHLIQIVEA
jgi:hypothetical protein